MRSRVGERHAMIDHVDDHLRLPFDARSAARAEDEQQESFGVHDVGDIAITCAAGCPALLHPERARTCSGGRPRRSRHLVVMRTRRRR